MTTGLYDDSAKNLPPKISSAVILLHGYGADGNDLLSPISNAWRDVFPEMAFIAPNGLIKRSVFGYEWFRLTNISEEEITSGVLETENAIWGLVAEVARTLQLPLTKIFLLGFSQGTIVALHAALKHKDLLGGVIGFSGALPDRKNIATSLKQKPPVLLIHGELDPVVPAVASEVSAQALQAAGVAVQLVLEPDLAHAIGPMGFNAATEFLQKHLA
ncbi:MAG: dienelactone hydrolase family protein [Hydrotalea sp.]|nr:dienelactone hydrolase family protein [Hydrotalea sp.]